MNTAITPQNLLIIAGLIGAGLFFGYLLFKGDKPSISNPGEIPAAIQAVRKTVADVEAKADLPTMAADVVADLDAMGKLGFTLNHPAIAGATPPAKP